MPEGSLVKNAFKESMNLCNLGYSSWCSKVCELAKMYNIDIMSYTFSDKTKCLIKEIVSQKFITDWKTKLYETDKYPVLRTYSLFKFEFKIEPYIVHIKNSKFRNAMIRFRASSHNLEIEKGRHMHPKIPLDKRLCKICKVVEDEMHFLLHCPQYKENRDIYLANVSEIYPLINNLSDEDKFVFLLSFNDPQILTWTAKFIYYSFQKRDQAG